MINIKFSSGSCIKGQFKHKIQFRIINPKKKKISNDEYRIHLTTTLRDNLSIQFDLGSLSWKKDMFFYDEYRINLTSTFRDN